MDVLYVVDILSHIESILVYIDSRRGNTMDVVNTVDVVDVGGYCQRCEVILGMNFLPP